MTSRKRNYELYGGTVFVLGVSFISWANDYTGGSGQLPYYFTVVVLSDLVEALTVVAALVLLVGTRGIWHRVGRRDTLGRIGAVIVGASLVLVTLSLLRLVSWAPFTSVIPYVNQRFVFGLLNAGVLLLGLSLRRSGRVSRSRADFLVLSPLLVLAALGVESLPVFPLPARWGFWFSRLLIPAMAVSGGFGVVLLAEGAETDDASHPAGERR